MKYYPPNIEDIRIGYECEWIEVIPEFQKGDESDWSQLVVSYLDTKWFSKMITEGAIRTPVLTKEQIEGEGWKLDFSRYVTPGVVFLKGDKTCWVLGVDNLILIRDKNDITMFKGTCPSINEFRTICKLLNIK